MSLGDLFRGVFKSTAYEAIGFEGSNSQSRWMGAVSGAAPTVGDYEAGDWVIDLIGGIWTCTVAGSPGSWVKSANSSGLGVSLWKNEQFTLASSGASTCTLTYTPVVKSPHVSLNGVIMLEGTDYFMVGSTVNIQTAAGALSGDIVDVRYQYSSPFTTSVGLTDTFDRADSITPHWLAYKSYTPPTAAGSRSITFDTPITLVPGTDYYYVLQYNAANAQAQGTSDANDTFTNITVTPGMVYSTSGGGFESSDSARYPIFGTTASSGTAPSIGYSAAPNDYWGSPTSIAQKFRVNTTVTITGLTQYWGSNAGINGNWGIASSVTADYSNIKTRSDGGLWVVSTDAGYDTTPRWQISGNKIVKRTDGFYNTDGSGHSWLQWMKADVGAMDTYTIIAGIYSPSPYGGQWIGWGNSAPQNVDDGFSVHLQQFEQFTQVNGPSGTLYNTSFTIHNWEVADTSTIHVLTIKYNRITHHVKVDFEGEVFYDANTGMAEMGTWLGVGCDKTGNGFAYVTVSEGI